ncbi:nucleotide exchange factor GrpE [Pontibacter liquoris]|uniref:nucleotide exchange factor GrpE n=1 Tax=Pontibacter liquoris TaxID=2905677 RepID=UPI001FA77A73|nr:nucleotide exchange factor GrpE [Pontibacter liquoris]
MSDKDSKNNQAQEEIQENAANAATPQEEQTLNQQEETDETEATPTDTAAAELAEMKDKYIRLMAEFENFRRRTAKERIDLSKTATQELMGDLLPVLDDMERARQALGSTKEVDVLAQGLDLVFHKLKHVTQQKGLKPIEVQVGDNFDSDLQEAVTQAPAPSDDLKGKVIDIIEKGYTLNDKVIRFSKVIIGA